MQALPSIFQTGPSLTSDAGTIRLVERFSRFVWLILVTNFAARLALVVDDCNAVRD